MLFSELGIPVYTSMGIVYALFKFITTPKVHFELFSFSLAPTTSLSCTHIAFTPVSMHPLFVLLTQAWLAQPQWPHPRVNLIDHDIAATPAVHRC